MKTKLIAFFIGLVTMSSFAQKNELKTAEKAIKKKDYAAATAALKTAEPLIANAEKYKAKFYFLKGQTYAAKKEYKVAAEAYNTLLDYEKKAGKRKYTQQAKPLLENLTSDLTNKAFAQYESKDYKNAYESFYLRYTLAKQDTMFLSNAAQIAFQAGELERSLELYKKLKSLGYTGIVTIYSAREKETGAVETFGSKAQRDQFVKLGAYINPKDKVSESKRGEIIKNIGLILTRQGKVEEAVIAVKEARAAFPEDMTLLLTEADLYIKLEKMDKFGELMEVAVKKDPNNPILYYNLGVVSYNQQKLDDAKKYYLKALELKPDYNDAYMNLAVTILDGEKAIIEEMNKNLSDFDKYDELALKQKALYKEAMPYLEKADAGSRSLDTVRTLLNIYETLEVEEKAKVFRELYKKMRAK
ncbi:MAG: tetratricopeptide repeat protein [Flavobacteriaceae bacterium]